MFYKYIFHLYCLFQTSNILLQTIWLSRINIASYFLHLKPAYLVSVKVEYKTAYAIRYKILQLQKRNRLLFSFKIVTRHKERAQ